MKLISMTDFVLEQYEIKFRYKAKQTSDRIENYANFLKKPLILEMFVPCDENGKVLDAEPCSLGMFEKDNPYYDIYLKDKNEWGKAKDRCLFEGFEVVTKDFNKTSYKFVQNKDIYVYFYDELKTKWTKVNDYNTVEDLVKYEPQLTKTAIKQIEL